MTSCRRVWNSEMNELTTRPRARSCLLVFTLANRSVVKRVARAHDLLLYRTERHLHSMGRQHMWLLGSALHLRLPLALLSVCTKLTPVESVESSVQQHVLVSCITIDVFRTEPGSVGDAQRSSSSCSSTTSTSWTCSSTVCVVSG